jgi:hypothetical protein
MSFATNGHILNGGDAQIGFGPPLAVLTGGRSNIFEVADRLPAGLARIWPKPFAYQILI